MVQKRSPIEKLAIAGVTFDSNADILVAHVYSVKKEGQTFYQIEFSARFSESDEGELGHMKNELTVRFNPARDKEGVYVTLYKELFGSDGVNKTTINLTDGSVYEIKDRLDPYIGQLDLPNWSIYFLKGEEFTKKVPRACKV